MKGITFTVLFCILMFAARGQHGKSVLAMSVAGSDRLSVVKNSVRLAEWHEKSFWPLYEKYMSDATKIYSETYRSLRDLAATDKASSEQEAFENGWKLLTSRNDALELRKKYYQQVGSALNGVVALEFLQTEAMMDMLESTQIYSKSQWEKFRFHAHALPEEKVKEAKHNMLAAAVPLTKEKEKLFWTAYLKYEDECDALLGEGYSVYGLFAGDANDFTPAIAKRLGHDLLEVMEREVRLKERYFLEINATVGPMEAARFLAWEDYYSLISKMYTWTEN